MDGKTNKNNHNKQTNHDDNQSDDLSMFRRSNDFRTRKRKKFKDKVDDEQSFSSSYDDNDKEKTNSDDNVMDSNHYEDHQTYQNESDDPTHTYSESRQTSQELEHQYSDDYYETESDIEKNGSSDDLGETSHKTNKTTKNRDKKSKENWFQKLTRKTKSTDKKDETDYKQQDYDSKVTQFNSPTLEEKRAQRRQRQKRIQYTVITVLVLLIVVFLLYMFTPLSKISNVKIEGNHNVSKNQINKALDVKPSSRMYTFSKSKAKSNLKEKALIKDVKITKVIPNTLDVNVTEYQVVGLEKSKDNYVPVLEDGKELKDYDGEIAHDVPIIDGFKEDKKEKMIQALSEMSPKARNLIAEISYAPDKNKQNRIKIFTKDNIQVIGDITTIADKMKYYPQMSESLSRSDSGDLKTDGYIDLSVGASFIPYKNSTGAQSESEQSVSQTSQKETDAKEELQSVLNKINKDSKENN
ncbi:MULTISPECIES: cell division protein FtsQ/DivIB [Staphylococcus]|uniref:cell division protein FtsQ/DivIB n=1 Tax=Staphylococcus TaxID=1279 RepID=UPI00024631CA|nr:MULTISPECIES: FtsQ-type POTRA domain-containing protein [Staphylococcus]QAV31531.1 cell division protein FtsQ [Sulfitobacter donghicola]AGZ26507.1 cell division protein FtsQ [Staphylococcus pasteuri SP1]KAB7647208.1 FtsQ-type POTRA domain-containing protein [Staphylococcus sp. B2-b]MBN6852005.1 FtsQ-type POTRA domain-containing protein [Staphylococcus warneri]MBT2769206.1 FtsQ-type POTRA domain-containing protein [Staphylococcus warneri]